MLVRLDVRNDWKRRERERVAEFPTEMIAKFNNIFDFKI